MKVYRKNIFIINHVIELPVKQIGTAWYNPFGHKVALRPQNNTVIVTGAGFEGYTSVIHRLNIQANSYYRYDGTRKSRSKTDKNNYAIWTTVTADTAASLGRIAIFNIMEGTYTGKDMGERSITATIDFPSRIDFQIGDYVEFEIANLERTTSIHGGSGLEKFYIYTMPTVKKVASRLSFGKAFQHTVTFYPCQYELATVKMRDVLQDISSGVIYTGYDEFSFYGGANTLMKRIMAVLDERFGHTGVAGKDYWSYQIADSINEDRNTALEKFQFDFSDSNVMEALLKLNDAEGINTKFFINERMIYVGFKRPYIVGVNEHNQKRDIPFEFTYGKTSHLPIETNHGNLYTITKSNGSASPITRLYAYGAGRNLQRFYCSDRIKTGRYVNKLMLPSFEDDGRTDYIDSPEGIARFGIREGTKTFENIYPSLRFFYYGNLRDVKYCIKLMGSGLESDEDGIYDGGTNISKTNVTSEQIERAKAEVDRAKHDGIADTAKVIITVAGKDHILTVSEADQLINNGIVHFGSNNGTYYYPIARIQCYRVEELLDTHGNHTGMNHLVESAPPVDLAVFCHATGKVVKCVLYAAKDGQTSTQRQYAADGIIPQRYNNHHELVNIVGSCFAVHDGHPSENNKHFECGHTHPSLTYPGKPNSDQRAAWFVNAESLSREVDGVNYDEYINQVSIHQIHYTDDHWITDVYEFTDYHQEIFNRQGYSAYCWPRVNKYYPNSQADNIEVNAIVDVGPVLIEDTDLNISQGQQQKTFDIYMRDVGFKINEQTWFGDKCFLFDTCKISFLDGNLGGYEFEMPTESDQDKLGSIYVPALTPDGERNPDFFDLADNPAQAVQAYQNGAFWRIVAKRAETEVDRYWVPNVNINASAGDHVVFLDIFMPDLYIRVAEQRLLKEAKKYLDANDDGDIQYSFDFDKVRMLKQPTFPLQMREGAIMRVIDDDLDIGTVNAQKILFEDKNGLITTTSMVKLSASVDEGVEIITRDCYYIENNNIPRAEYGKTTGDNPREYLIFQKAAIDSVLDFDIRSGITIRIYVYVYYLMTYLVRDYKVLPTEIVADQFGRYIAYLKSDVFNIDSFAAYLRDTTNNIVYVGYSVRKQTLTPVYNENILPIGRQIFCISNNLIEFKRNKHYEIDMDIIESDLLVEDTASKKQMFALVNGLGEGEVFYYPDYTAVDATPEGETFKRFHISFDLPEDFSDEKDYYVAFLCASNGTTEAVHIRLWSVIERDDEALEDLNYVDLAIDTVTIKFHDNTRDKDVSLQDGQEPERLRDNLSEMSREVTATVKEESRATAWAQLMDRMTEAEQLQDQTLDFYQSLVDAARKHYLELLNLKNSIFDPDGTCNETFLQIMMLQVGADSMNYQLKYTHYSINGHTSNCGVESNQSEQTDSTSGKPYRDQFKIGNADEVLDHYVYTEHPTNGEGGRWYPQERNTTWNLHKITDQDGTDIYPVYFIALKASLTSPQDCHWVCEPTQHATNELVDAPNTQDRYFYFNWGILAPINADNPDASDYGKYTLTETRGNAYMYGDNLICGQISTLAGNSYFDLTHGNFVLSKDGPDGNWQYHEGLTYINGVLTIYGLNDEDGIGKVIKDLRLDMDNMEIGGENLCILDGGKYYFDNTFEGGGSLTSYIELFQTSINQQGGGITRTYVPEGKYVFSAKEVYGKVTRNGGIPVSDVSFELQGIDQSGNTHYYKNISGNNVKEAFEITTQCSFRIKVSYTFSQDNTVTIRLIDIMLQRGTKPTNYEDYVKHLTDALHGSTEIAGGLTMTNLLMLKNEFGDVVAGMSGMTDSGRKTIAVPGVNGSSIARVVESEGVTLWGGGDYLQALNQAMGLARELPVLLTKTGIRSRLGCFEVVSANSVAVYDENLANRILLTSGKSMSIKMQKKVSGRWTDLLIINTDDISVKYEIFTMGRTIGCPLVKRSSDSGLSQFFIKFIDENGDFSEQITVPAGCTCDISSYTKMFVSIGTSMSDFQLNNITMVGSIALVKINTDNTYTIIDSANINAGSSIADDSLIEWSFYLSDFTGNYQNLAAGNYGLLFTIDHFVRENDAGVSYTEHMYNSKWEDCSIGVSILNDVHFSKSSTEDRTIMKIGRNGMLIAHGANSYFMAKNDSSNMDVQIGGLPTSPDSSKPNSLYKAGGYIMIN